MRHGFSAIETFVCSECREDFGALERAALEHYRLSLTARRDEPEHVAALVAEGEQWALGARGSRGGIGGRA